MEEHFYKSATPTGASGYLWAPILRRINDLGLKDNRIFELGCGNGTFAKKLYDQGYSVTGVDVSESGIMVANNAFPELDLKVGSAYDDLASTYGQFPCVICLEVIEHCYSPESLARTMRGLMSDEGYGIISTPYHGYVKNLALVAAGRFDKHFTPLWEGGHIKFFSINTLRALLENVGFKDIEIFGVGRVPVMAKSMIAIFRKY